jgi:hypothetical protein
MFCHYICNPKRNEAHQYLLNKWKERTSEMFKNHAKVAQLVEHDLAKVGVASSNLVFRSKCLPTRRHLFKG